MTQQQEGPAAGWYPDTQMSGTQRYWDGNKWTDHVAPLPAATQNNDGLMVFGIVMAVVFPILGLILGLVLVGRGEQRGLVATGLSIVFGAIWFGVAYNGGF